VKHGARELSKTSVEIQQEHFSFRSPILVNRPGQRQLFGTSIQLAARRCFPQTVGRILLLDLQLADDTIRTIPDTVRSASLTYPEFEDSCHAVSN